MDVEQRVKALEQEMKILKNQVQKTLLDIQEQILVHYHPTLRTEDPTVEDNLEAARPSGPNTGSKVRQVSLAELRQPTRPFPDADLADPASPTPNVTPSTQEDPNYAGLAEWVGDSVGKIGAERTRQLLDLRAANGSISPGVYDTLQQLIMLCDGNEGAEAAETAVLLQQLNQLLK